MTKIKNCLQRCLLPSIQGRGRGGGLLFTLSLFTMILLSCSQESVPTYDTSQTGLDIWVGTSGGAVYESVSYNYSYSYDDGTLTFYAQINGLPVDYDRTFRMEPLGEYADEVRATMRQEDYVVRANTIGGTYKIHFNTQALPDPSLFSEEDGIVEFRMVPNDVFNIGTEGHQQFTVIMKNYLAKPDNWDAVPPSQTLFIYEPLSKYFGSFSRVKYQFMIQVLGLIDFNIRASMGSLPNYDEETNTISAPYALQLKYKMQSALSEYNATHDTPLTDEYGYEVVF